MQVLELPVRALLFHLVMRMADVLLVLFVLDLSLLTTNLAMDLCCPRYRSNAMFLVSYQNFPNLMLQAYSICSNHTLANKQANAKEKSTDKGDALIN